MRPPGGVRSPPIRLHRLRVTLRFRTDPRSKTIRARTLAALIAVGFAVIDVMRELELVGFVFNQPFDLDWALRTVSLGWYEGNFPERRASEL